MRSVSKWLVGLICWSCCGGIASGCSGSMEPVVESSIGRRFDDFGSLQKSEVCADWLVLGRIGRDGPFEIIAERAYAPGEECVFQVGNTQHVYGGLANYEKLVLWLRGAQDTQSALVLRARQRTVASPGR